MRIISGKCKGRVIAPPKNLRARPTTDFAKENIFNVLGNWIDFEGVEALDLFAGTGSISYELASRGASGVIAVEINTVHYNFIRATVAALGLQAIHPVKANAFLYLKSTERRFDLIFSDAPYDLEGAETVVDTVFERSLLRKGGWLVFEDSGRCDFSAHPHFVQRRSYGSVHFSIFCHKTEEKWLKKSLRCYEK